MVTHLSYVMHNSKPKVPNIDLQTDLLRSLRLQTSQLHRNAMISTTKFSRSHNSDPTHTTCYSSGQVLEADQIEQLSLQICQLARLPAAVREMSPRQRRKTSLICQFLQEVMTCTTSQARLNTHHLPLIPATRTVGIVTAACPWGAWRHWGCPIWH